MPITAPAHVRTPAEIAAVRVAGTPEARCATCAYLLVELPRPIRVPIPREGGAPLTVTVTHAHAAADDCPSCEGLPTDNPLQAAIKRECAAEHGAPCAIAEPVPCSNGDCDLPAGIRSDYCACCGDTN